MHTPDVQKALSEAVSVIYLEDSSDYIKALWGVVKALGGDDAVSLLMVDPEAAVRKFCETQTG